MNHRWLNFEYWDSSSAWVRSGHHCSHVQLPRANIEAFQMDITATQEFHSIQAKLIPKVDFAFFYIKIEDFG